MTRRRYYRDARGRFITREDAIALSARGRRRAPTHAERRTAPPTRAKKRRALPARKASNKHAAPPVQKAIRKRKVAPVQKAIRKRKVAPVQKAIRKRKVAPAGEVIRKRKVAPVRKAIRKRTTNLLPVRTKERKRRKRRQPERKVELNVRLTTSKGKGKDNGLLNLEISIRVPKSFADDPAFMNEGSIRAVLRGIVEGQSVPKGITLKAINWQRGPTGGTFDESDLGPLLKAIMKAKIHIGEVRDESPQNRDDA